MTIEEYLKNKNAPTSELLVELIGKIFYTMHPQQYNSLVWNLRSHKAAINYICYCMNFNIEDIQKIMQRYKTLVIFL